MEKQTPASYCLGLHTGIFFSAGIISSFSCHQGYFSEAQDPNSGKTGGQHATNKYSGITGEFGRQIIAPSRNNQGVFVCFVFFFLKNTFQIIVASIRLVFCFSSTSEEELDLFIIWHALTGCFQRRLLWYIVVALTHSVFLLVPTRLIHSWGLHKFLTCHSSKANSRMLLAKEICSVQCNTCMIYAQAK